MDLMWASDISNTRKHAGLPVNTNSNDIMSHDTMSSLESRTVGSRLSYTPPSTNDHPKSDISNLSRRSRADTMPTSLAAPFIGGGYAQQRPNLYQSGMSSPLDENATHSIASTLASLGLNEDTQHPYFEPTTANTRNRSYTVSSNMMEHQRNHQDMMSFSPFVSTTTRRPRALSVGIQESTLPPPPTQHNTFFPFDSLFDQKESTQNYQGNTNVNLTDGTNALRYPSRNLFTHMDEEEDDTHFDMDHLAQTPSRALWLGNVSPSLSVPDLYKLFARYGVESARILSDKECAFVNFETVESALAAKDDLVNRLGCKIAGAVVKVGFGKADVGVAMALTNEAGPNAQGPTRALWVGNIPANINPAVLRSLFQSFGNIESIRILSHKNCGFVNFERQEDAVHARKALQNKEILGLGSGTVRIGFAKAPAHNPDEVIQDVVISGNTITSYPLPNKRPTQKVSTTENAAESNTTQWATVLLMASMMMNASSATKQPDQQESTTSNATQSNYTQLANERNQIMQQLGYEPEPNEFERVPIAYFSTIPSVPEFGAERTLGPLRLREIRKSLDNGYALSDIEYIAQECMNDIVELCSDYIGNTVIQKLFEYCSEETKLSMIQKIAPYLASIGVHKNGTWAAQKIIDTARTEEQIQLICHHIAPYVPLLLLDQFGNYVVQCCLRMGPTRNQYILDAIVDKCWEIGQGRFGSRAVRAILENPIVTKKQQIYVASAIMQNALLLTTNVNGSILLNWLLDTSGLLGHFRNLCHINNN